MGRGGALSGGPRSDFPDTAQWFPTLRTDANGEATVSFTLPDSLTSWRLTAKATTADTQVGETFANIVTQQPVIVRPFLPRGLTAGDQVALSVMVHNYDSESHELAVTLEIGKLEATITGDATQIIELAPGEQRLVGWPVSVESAGDAEVIVRAEVGGETWDAVLVEMPVRPLAVPDFSSQVGEFSGELATTVLLPDDALPMTNLQLELSRSIAGSLLQGLSYLTGYPYGCVEQTMSKALPNAVIGRALAQLGVQDLTLEADLPDKINAGLQRLYGYQHNDGGWGWWYDDSTDVYQTAWVIFGLQVTAEAGYEVDPAVIERGATWLQENMGSEDIRTQAYALYSLARAGYGDLAAGEELAGRLEELDPFSQAALALALHELGADDQASEIVDYLAGTAIVRNGKAYWSGDEYDGYYYQKTMASPTRSTALALSAFVQIRPGHELEGSIVRWLMSQRRSHGWGSTNETSFTILGLTDHLLAGQTATADTEYQVLLNGATVASGRLGAGEPAVSVGIPTGEMMTGLNTLRVTQSGTGKLYYTIRQQVYRPQLENRTGRRGRNQPAVPGPADRRADHQDDGRTASAGQPGGDHHRPDGLCDRRGPVAGRPGGAQRTA